jgi:TPR repeat protein
VSHDKYIFNILNNEKKRFIAILKYKKKSIRQNLFLEYYYHYVEKNYDEMKKYYGLAIEMGNNKAINKLFLYEKEIFIQNISQNTSYKNMSIINVQNECLICNVDTFQYMINTKCNNKYDHYYCFDCFKQWYKNNKNKCIACINTLIIDNFNLAIYQE